MLTSSSEDYNFSFLPVELLDIRVIHRRVFGHRSLSLEDLLQGLGNIFRRSSRDIRRGLEAQLPQDLLLDVFDAKLVNLLLAVCCPQSGQLTLLLTLGTGVVTTGRGGDLGAGWGAGLGASRVHSAGRVWMMTVRLISWRIALIVDDHARINGSRS